LPCPVSAPLDTGCSGFGLHLCLEFVLEDREQPASAQDALMAAHLLVSHALCTAHSLVCWPCVWLYGRQCVLVNEVVYISAEGAATPPTHTWPQRRIAAAQNACVPAAGGLYGGAWWWFDAIFASVCQHPCCCRWREVRSRDLLPETLVHLCSALYMCIRLWCIQHLLGWEENIGSSIIGVNPHSFGAACLGNPRCTWPMWPLHPAVMSVGAFFAASPDQAAC
jgi:hypothetical protein